MSAGDRQRLQRLQQRPAALRLVLPALPEAVPEVRRAVREFLGGSCGAAELCVTELLANVIRHVGEGVPVSVRVAAAPPDGRIRVEVTDPAPQSLPAPLCPGADDESGRGLALLDAAASRWGVQVGAPEVPRRGRLRTRVGRGGVPSAPPRPIPPG
ncbi:ATP-binding protein [Streptomyces poriticola]|uniref:ATP-binding protein n=1 Tax=Streptomyces poriticola TaxID=3120506 RepID=UPI002FCE2C00